MKAALLFVFFHVWGLVVRAQNMLQPLSLKCSRLNAVSAKQADAFSFTGNIAVLARLPSSGIGLFSERRFLLNELNHSAAAAVIKTGSGGYGLRMLYSGFTDYNEMNTGLSYGRSLGTKLDLGLGFVYNNMRIKTYGTSSSLVIEAGSVWQISEQIRTGFQFSQCIQGNWPLMYRFAIGYDPSLKTFIGFSIEKQENKPADVLAGIRYEFTSQFLVKAGVSSSPASGWLGIGFSWKKTQLSVTLYYHPQLGVTPGLNLGFHFKEK